MRTLTRDNKIEVAKAIVGLAIWFVATSVDLSTFVVLNMILTFVANILIPTAKVKVWSTECDSRFGAGSSIGIPLITTAVFSGGVWYLLNWLF